MVPDTTEWNFISCWESYRTRIFENAGTGWGSVGTLFCSRPLPDPWVQPTAIQNHLNNFSLFSICSLKEKHTSRHNRRVGSSGWRPGRRVRLQHKGSCCMWWHPLLLASLPWERTCSTCWCVDRSTPWTSDTSSHLCHLLHTTWEAEQSGYMQYYWMLKEEPA